MHCAPNSRLAFRVCAAPWRAALVAATVLLGACGLQHYTAAPPDETGVALEFAAATLSAPAQLAQLASVGTPRNADGTPWTLSQLGVLAAARSRAVAAARSEITAAAAHASVAKRRPNPQFNLALERHSMEEDGSDSLWSVGPTIDLTLVPPAVRRLGGERADLEVAIARLEAIEAAWQARNAAIDAALSLDALRVEARHLAQADALRDEAVRAARALVAAGIADPFEWQTMELDRNDARLARLGRTADVARARAGLAAALSLPVTAIAQLEEVRDDLAPLPDYPECQARMLKAHPAVLRALAEHAKAERELALAVAAQYPSVQLSPGFFFDQGDHVWSLLGGVVVPLFARHDDIIASAAAARDVARDRVYATQASAIIDLQRAHAGWDAASTVLVEARALVDDIRRSHAVLRRKREQGIGDDLALARAALQLAEAEAQAARAGAEVGSLRAAVLAQARIAEQDPAFARWLVQLTSATPAGEGEGR